MNMPQPFPWQRPLLHAPGFIPNWTSRQQCEVPPGREPTLELGTESRAFFSRILLALFFFSLKYKDVQFFWFQFSIGEFYNLVIKISDRL